MVVNGTNKKSATQTRDVAVRLLVLGDKQVGKSASIVRYTTGRYIQEYSDATSDWLYRHPLGYDQKKNQNTTVEILEQKDIKFCNSGNFFSSSTQTNQTNQAHQSLASRVAQDQQLANELQEKQEMLNKLHWADAFIVIYAINEKSTFNKAIKYLNLIANNINSPIDSHRHSCSSSCSTSSFSSLGGVSSSGSTGGNFFNRLSPGQTNGFSNNKSSSSSLSPNQQGSNCNCNSSNNNNSTRRPILLLGNKRDLERSSRQVSTSDGRLLAIRHQSMFAELSIAESNKPIERFLANLIDQVDPTLLHQNNNHHYNQAADSIPRTLEQWKPTLEAALGQSSIQLAAPICGNLVKSKPVGSTMIAQTSKVVSAKLETSDIYSSKPIVLVAQSVEVGAIKRQAGSCSLLKSRNSIAQSVASSVMQAQPMQCTKPTPIPSTTSNYQNKYRNLKSSFKRASMAIVSTKGLGKNSSRFNNLNKRSSTTSSEQDSISELSAISGQSSKTIDSQNIGSSNNHTSELLQTKTSTLMSERFRRPLFRYKNRRTTVAFEEIGADLSNKSQLTNSQINHSKLSLNKAGGGSGYDSAHNSSARSSSSLSVSDTNYGSSLMLSDLEQPSRGRFISIKLGGDHSSNQNNHTSSLTLIRNNSNTTLSHASTSGGSYEDSGDEFTLNSVNTRINVATRNSKTSKSESPVLTELLANHDQINHSPSTVKKRYDLVKSVQSTLSNLTRSSNVSGHAPKRSFCSTLFRHSNPNATISVKKVTEPPVMVDMAKTEHIGPIMPVMVGFCK